MPSEQEYLIELQKILADYSAELRALNEKSQYHAEMHDVLKQVAEKEKTLREKHQVGVRFSVVQQQIQKLLTQFEAQLAEAKQQDVELAEKVRQLADDEILVYVHLFNAQGRELTSWQSLFTKKSLIDHSANRPVYLTKAEVEEVLRARMPKEQHACLTVIMKSADVFSDKNIQDAFGHKLVRLRQGSILLSNILNFHHCAKDYQVGGDGKIK